MHLFYNKSLLLGASDLGHQHFTFKPPSFMILYRSILSTENTWNWSNAPYLAFSAFLQWYVFGKLNHVLHHLFFEGSEKYFPIYWMNYYLRICTPSRVEGGVDGFTAVLEMLELWTTLDVISSGIYCSLMANLFWYLD